jgi:HSP20 family molecular chaperone IbpA
MRFEEIFREMEELHKRMREEMFKGFGSFEDSFFDFDSLKERVEAGDLEGNWSFEPIDRPGMKGFIAKGYFSTPGLIERPPLDRPTDILPPIKPSLKEPREPLYDINVGENTLTLFVELPGVEEKDIQLEFEERKLKLKAGNFQTEIDLSSWVISPEKKTTEYRNGVLKITIPKTKLDEQLI